MFKFFNRKKEDEVSSLNKRTSNWKMITSLSCATLLGLGAIGGIVGSIITVAKKYKLADDYSNSYLCRYELDPYRNDDPTQDGVGDSMTKDQITKLADKSANSFSHYLSSMGYSTAVKVTSEVYYDETLGHDRVYVDAYIPKSEVKPGSDNPITGGWDSSTTYYSQAETNYVNHVNSNRISMIVDPNDGNDIKPDDGDAVSPAPMAVNMEEIVSNPSSHIKVDKDSVNIQFDGDGNTVLNRGNWFDESGSGFLYNNFSTNGTDSTDVPSDAKGEVYILKDQDSLVNRMTFILQCALYGSSKELNKSDWAGWSENGKANRQMYADNWRYLTQNEQDWALAVLQCEDNNIYMKDNFKLVDTTPEKKIKYYPFAGNMAIKTPTGYSENYSGKDSIIPDGGNVNTGEKAIQDAMGYFYRFIDTKTYTKPGNLGNAIPAPKGHSGDGVAWDWMKPYVVAIINKDTALTKPTTYDSLGKSNAYFPNKNPNDSSSKADKKNFGKYLSIKFKTEFDAKQFKDSFTTYGFPMPVKSFNITTSNDVNPGLNDCTGVINAGDYNATTKQWNKGIDGINGVINVSSDLKGNMLNKSAILASILSLVLVIVIIGIIVSVIFRVPGVLSFLFGTCSASMALLFLVLANNPISLGIIVGLFTGYILATMSVFIFMQKLHKYLKREENMISGFKKALNNSVWKIIDIHVLGIIVSVCLTYFGISITNMFALTLLLFCLVDIVLVGLWVLTCALLLLTKKTDSKTNLVFPKWYFIKNVIEVENTTFNDKKFETTYMPYYKKVNFGFMNKCAKACWKVICSPYVWVRGMITGNYWDKHEKLEKQSNGFRINFFGIKKELISLGILVAIMIVGTVLLFTIGSHSSYYFFGGTRIVINANLANAQEIVNQLKHNGFTDLSKDGGYWYIYSSKTYEASDFGGITGGVLNSTFFVERVGHISMSGYISKFAIVFLIASAIASAYGFFRIGWTSVLPIFIGSLLAPLLALLAIFTFQIYIDTNVFLFIAVLYALSMVMVFGYISNVDNRWTKHQKFDIRELKTAYNLETASSFRFYYLLVSAIIVIAAGTLMIFGSTDLIASFGFLLIGLVATIAVMIIVVRPICFWMTVARFSYSRRVGENNFFFKKNYDKVDEQNIEGINKFKKETIQL